MKTEIQIDLRGDESGSIPTVAGGRETGAKEWLYGLGVTHLWAQIVEEESNFVVLCKKNNK